MWLFVEIEVDCEVVEFGGVQAEVMQLSDRVGKTWLAHRSDLTEVATLSKFGGFGGFSKKKTVLCNCLLE